MKKKIIIILIVIFSILILGIVVLKNLYLGYDIEHIIYDKNDISQNVDICVPKLSFMKKENDKSYSYKNIRGNKLLNKEIKSYLNTLSKIECNQTTYYYDKKNDFTIVNYSVKNHILYNTISYEVRYGNYCSTIKLNEYSKKLDGLRRYHTLNGGKVYLNEDWDSKIEVLFLDGVANSSKNYEFRVNLKIYHYKRKSDKEFYTYVLEDSIGGFEIKDDKLYYYRTDISESSGDIKIPDISIFKIEDGKLTLMDNYLKNYYDKDIVLK